MISTFSNNTAYLEILAPVVSHQSASMEGIELDPEPEVRTPEIIGFVRLFISQQPMRIRLNRALSSIVMVTCLIVLVAIFLNFLLTRRLIAPLTSLVQATEEISEGRLDHRLEVNTQDELSQLAESFNRMLKNLQISRERVEEYQDSLERKVEQRTAELVTANLLADQAHSKGLDLNVDIPLDVPNIYQGDAVRIRQILLNLLGNATKFTQAGEIIIRLILITQHDQQYVFRFEIEDTGIGMTSASQERIFESFTQVDGSTTRKFGGIGLGLAISRLLVELMGGEMGLHSEVDKGSCFWFTLPL